MKPRIATTHPRSTILGPMLLAVFACTASFGCLDEVDLGGWGTDGTTVGDGGEDSPTDDGVDESGDDGSGGGEGDGGGEPCGYPGMLGSYELEVVPTANQDGFHHRRFSPSVAPGGDCNFAGLTAWSMRSSPAR